MPRLELQAAPLAARLAKYVSEECEFRIARRYFWSDSRTVLSWIKTEPRVISVSVSHRLGEIAQFKGIAGWRWVPSDLNPAGWIRLFRTSIGENR